MTTGLDAFPTGGGEVGARMRALEWSASPLGTPETWPPSLRTAVALMVDSRQPMFLAWGPDLGFLYNDAYAPLLGTRHPGALGRPFRSIWADIWTDIWPLIERALSGESTWSEDFRLRTERNDLPEDAWFSFSYSPLRDDAGRVGGMFCAVTETTASVLAKRRLAFQIDLAERLTRATTPREVVSTATEALARHLGVARVGFAEVQPDGEYILVERDSTDGGVPSVAGRHRMEDFGPPIIAELRAGRTMWVEDVARDPRTAGPAADAFAAIRTRTVLAVPLMRSGRLAALLYLHHPQPRRWTRDDASLAEDVVGRTWAALEQARSETALRESERRLRLAIEAGRLSAWEFDLRSGVGSRAGPLATDLPTVPQQGFAFADWMAQIHPEDRNEVERRFGAVARGEAERFDTEFRVRRPGGTGWVWLSSFGAAVEHDPRTAEVLRIAGVAQDISMRKRAEERSALLAREVDHRAKNALSVVLAALKMTRAPDLASFVRVVEGRVYALARAQTLLAKDRWEGADLHTLLEGELTPFLQIGDGPRADLDGPAVALPPGTTQPLAMIFHELATNAVKHGALSLASGRLAIGWQVVSDQPGVLRFRWTESGGPAVAHPKGRRGFGTRLLDTVIRQQLGGTLALSWNPSGLACDIEIPLRPRTNDVEPSWGE